MLSGAGRLQRVKVTMIAPRNDIEHDTRGIRNASSEGSHHASILGEKLYPLLGSTVTYSPWYVSFHAITDRLPSLERNLSRPPACRSSGGPPRILVDRSICMTFNSFFYNLAGYPSGGHDVILFFIGFELQSQVFQVVQICRSGRW